MAALINLIVGYVASFIGLIPPGLLNMTAAKIGVKQGIKPAVLFSLGVSLVVCVQCYIGLVFARYLDGHPEIIDLLQKVGLGIFLALTVYFFLLAKDSRREIPSGIKRSKTNRFFYGVLLGTLNLLPIPYWVYVSITFSSFGWFSWDTSLVGLAVFGAGLGTFSMLIVYTYFFHKRLPVGKFSFNVNYLLGSITAFVSVITMVRIWQQI